MNAESKDIIVLGAIQAGIKKFDRIQKITQTKPEELKSSKLIPDLELNLTNSSISEDILGKFKIEIELKSNLC